ncbi:NmrA-like family protein [Pilatotrama ljubarskyi]|nr:NmrA-like family protein [Pilatotrama ljubarskyi]
MTKYVITGATGGLGARVLKHLLKLVPASDIVVSLYNPSGATQEIRDSGVEVRRGDYADPASLDAAFAGADKLLLVSHPSYDRDLRVPLHKNAIDAAKRAGVKHVYYTSLAYASDSVADLMQAHLDTENFLEKSGLTYTSIREGTYSEAVMYYFGLFDPARGNNEVIIPYSDGGIAFVCKDDLGEATAKIMLQDGFKNEIVLFSGSRAITMEEVAEIYSSVLGRTIRLVVSTEDEFVKANLGRPGRLGNEAWLRSRATVYKAMARGEMATVDPLSEQLLGRKPKPFEGTLKEMLGIGA